MRLFALSVLFIAMASAATNVSRYAISPSSIVRGKEYGIVIRDNDCDNSTGSLKGAVLKLVSAEGLSLGERVSNSNPCFLTATLSVSAEAAVDEINLVVAGEDGADLGLVSLPVSTVARPQVDISWKVLPRRATADSFGGKVSGRYFAVEVVIGNNSGYDLQISSVGFQPHAAPDGATPFEAPLPSDSYNVVRSTVEKEQQTGRRAMLVNAIRGLGPLLSAASAFYSNLGNQGKYNTAVGMFSNPLEKGLELVYPDRTLQQLVGLDTRALRDSVIVPNNLSQRMLVFISREVVECRSRKHRAKSPGDLRIAHASDFNPAAVMNALGNLVLVGKGIGYVNRVRVVSKAEIK